MTDAARWKLPVMPFAQSWKYTVIVMLKTLPTRYIQGALIALLVVISALVYLPRLNQIGYLNDDWYLMYSARAYGSGVFSDIFSVDRPMRALVLTPAYNLFGDHPLYYNLSAYVFRVISGISFFWLLQMLWPRRRRESFIAALLFLIYPGFLSQINGIDYQSQIVSLASAMLSIALSVKASQMRGSPAKWIVLLLATLLGWFYLGLVEYFLGLEVLRLMCLLLPVIRSQVSWKQKFFPGLRSLLPALIIPAVFLTWRVFFFESGRSATDIGSQLTQFRELPLATGTWWLARLIFNSFNVIFLAWGIPLYLLFSFLPRLRDLFFATAVTGVALLLLVWILRPFDDEPASEPDPQDFRLETLLLGLVSAFAGLVPVILVNRQADFGDFSRYTLASSPGSALVLVSILFYLTSRAVRLGMLSLLLAAAVFTHHANAIRVANDTRSLRAFWWQVSWRIPQLKMNTTLVANYPLTTIQEDYFVWGPANLIYYPEGMGGTRIRTGISAAVLNKETLLKILSQRGRESDNRRSIRSVIDYQNILILSKPTEGSCVQVIDGTNPQPSQFEEERVMVVAPFSEIDLIDLDAEEHLPPSVVFGPEPAHEWCYFYEKASLALQRNDWEEVVRLGNEALIKGFSPQDDIEWMPFLQAYAHAGDLDRLDRIRIMMKNSNPYVNLHVCQSLNKMTDLSQDVARIMTSFCGE
jgi:hypothetical protein